MTISTMAQALSMGIKDHLDTITKLNEQGIDGKRSALAVNALHQPTLDYLRQKTGKDWVLEYKIPDYFGGTHKADIGFDKTTFEFKCFKTSYAKNHKNYLRMGLSELQNQIFEGYSCNSIVIFKNDMMTAYQLSGWKKLADRFNVLLVEYDDNYEVSFPQKPLSKFIEEANI